MKVHPDKNPDDKDRAQAAFDAVRKSYSLLEDEKTRKKCFEIVEEARGRTGMHMEEKRRKKRKDAVSKGLPPTGENIRVSFRESIALSSPYLLKCFLLYNSEFLSRLMFTQLTLTNFYASLRLKKTIPKSISMQ